MAKRIITALAALGLFAGASTAKAAEFPEKPVEMTILFGGTAQTIGQLLAELMSKNMSEPVVAVSRPGGGGAIGYTHVNGTDPDGYNIVWNSNSISTGHHGGKIDFDYTAFQPIAKISNEVPAFAVRADSGWETLEDMVKDIEASGKKLKVGASGKGSFTHLTTMALLSELDLGDKVLHIPYDRGKAPVELLAGRIDAALQWPGQFIPHEGKITILCVTSAERISSLPDTPTCAESGADGMDITMWRGLAAPAGTPEDVVLAIEDAAKKAAESDAFKQAAERIGFEIDFQDHSAFGETIAADDERIAEQIRELGLRK